MESYWYCKHMPPCLDFYRSSAIISGLRLAEQTLPDEVCLQPQPWLVFETGLRTHRDQANLQLLEIYLPLPLSRLLALKMYTIMPDSGMVFLMFFKFLWMFFLHVCLCIICMSGAHRGTRVTDGFETPSGFWESNPGTL